MRMAGRVEFSPASFSFLGRAGHTLMAATPDGLVGVVTDELRTGIGSGALQHSVGACPGPPQS